MITVLKSLGLSLGFVLARPYAISGRLRIYVSSVRTKVL